MVPVTEELSGSLGGVMRRRRGLGSAVVGLTLGLSLGFFMLNYRTIAWKRSEVRSGANALSSEDDEMADVGGREMASGAVVGMSAESRRGEAARSLLYVGVMTAERYLGTRAKSVYETWGKDVSGKIEFFSSEISVLPENCSELPLVALPRVTDVYPPQKKSFLMLQYMWKNYGDRYEWFLRADDDVYVRNDKLEKLLRSVDSRKPMYIGQAGRGSNNERGHLSLEYNENFCMGGPGVILSRETLARIVPHIKHCLKNLYTTHEDVEVGRCVQKYAGISCTWSYEMAKIFHHNGSGKGAYTGNLKREEVHRAITLHPVKNPSHMYRIHNYMRGLRIQDLQQERIRLLRDVRAVTRELEVAFADLHKRRLAKNVTVFHNLRDWQEFSENYPCDVDVLGVPASLTSFQPRNSQEVIPWDFYTKLEYSLADLHPRKRIPSNVKESMSDITRQVMTVINSSSRQRGRIVEERSILYGYRRVNVHGADTILDLLLVYRKYRGRKVTLPVRRHVYLHQPFTGLEIREVVNCREVDQRERRASSVHTRPGLFPSGFLGFNEDRRVDPVNGKVIKFILPLSGRHSIFERFLKNYEEICLLRNERATLTIVLYRRANDESYERILVLVDETRARHGREKIDVTLGEGNFSRARALERGAKNFNDDDLLFFIDVDIVFTASALNRIRANTVRERRIYFPIVFSQFNPRVVSDDRDSSANFAINERSGLWREFGYGIVSIYKGDYRKIGGFDLSISGWGKEDVGLYEKALNSRYDILRSPDVNLIHVYHDVDCDGKLTSVQLAMCRGTRANTYAGTRVLAKIIFDHPKYLEFAKSRDTSATNSAA